jgi:triacylglycerol lipase
MKHLALLSFLVLMIPLSGYAGKIVSKNDGNKNPVLLVHGFHDKASTMRYVAKYLQKKGWKVYSVTLSPSSGQVGIEVLASQLDEFVKNNIPANQKFDLVGYSMGGLVSRYYVERLGGLQHMEHFITVSTPHHGTRIAGLLNNDGIKQMRTNSDFINDLNRESEMLNQIKFTSIWTPLDLTIRPASSSHIDIGDEVKVWCPLHFLMVHNHHCMQAIERALLK